MNNNDYIDVEYEKTDKKTKSNKFCKVGVICLLIFTLLWFLSSLFINITKLNSFDTEEEIKTELIDYKTFNKSRVIDNYLNDDIYSKNIVADLGNGVYTFEYYISNDVFIYGDSNYLYLDFSILFNYDTILEDFSDTFDLYLYYFDEGGGYEIEKTFTISSDYMPILHDYQYNINFMIEQDQINLNSNFQVKNGFQVLFTQYLFDSNDDYFTDYPYPLELRNSLNIGSVVSDFNNFITSLDYYYNRGYDVGYDDGLADTDGYDQGYNAGYNAGVNNGFADNAFKKLFNVIMNAPFNIFSGLLNFEIFGVNLFALFSFVFTTMIIFAIVKIFLK